MDDMANAAGAQKVPWFNWDLVMEAVKVLRKHDIEVCIGGDAALAYYNALPEYPRDSQDPIVEFIVDIADDAFAPGILVATGLSEPSLTSFGEGFNSRWLEQQVFPAVKAVCTTKSRLEIVIVKSCFGGLKIPGYSGPGDILESTRNYTHSHGITPGFSSSWMTDHERLELPRPKLPALTLDLAVRVKKVLENIVIEGDATGGILHCVKLMEEVVEELVIGMQLTREWAITHLNPENWTLCDLVCRMIDLCQAEDRFDAEQHKALLDYPGRGRD